MSSDASDDFCLLSFRFKWWYPNFCVIFNQTKPWYSLLFQLLIFYNVLNTSLYISKSAYLWLNSSSTNGSFFFFFLGTFFFSPPSSDEFSPSKSRRFFLLASYSSSGVIGRSFGFLIAYLFAYQLTVKTVPMKESAIMI